MYLKPYALLLITTLLSSCVVNGTLQGLYSYYDKTTETSPSLLQKPDRPVCDLVQPEQPIVFVINGAALKDCLSQHDRALLYIWGPLCSSDKCIALNYLQLYADKHDLELFVVAEYYDVERMHQKYKLHRPIFGVDCAYYKSNLVQKYLPRFLADVLGSTDGPDPEQDRFLLFEQGRLVKTVDELEQVALR